MIVGWAISKNIDHKLCIVTLEMAVNNRKASEELIHHSDRVQYSCKEYITKLEGNNIRISMSRIGNPYNNTLMESFFKTLKMRCIYGIIKDFIDVVEKVLYFIEEV
jgi:putative transposase